MPVVKLELHYGRGYGLWNPSDCNEEWRMEKAGRSVPLSSFPFMAPTSRLAPPGTQRKVKTSRQRHNGCSITPPTYVGGCMSAAVTDAGRLNPGNEVELARVPHDGKCSKQTQMTFTAKTKKTSFST